MPNWVAFLNLNFSLVAKKKIRARNKFFSENLTENLFPDLTEFFTETFPTENHELIKKIRDDKNHFWSGSIDFDSIFWVGAEGRKKGTYFWKHLVSRWRNYRGQIEAAEEFTYGSWN